MEMMKMKLSLFFTNTNASSSTSKITHQFCSRINTTLSIFLNPNNKHPNNSLSLPFFPFHLHILLVSLHSSIISALPLFLFAQIPRPVLLFLLLFARDIDARVLLSQVVYPSLNWNICKKSLVLMDQSTVGRLEDVVTIRKKRSQTSRRPRPEAPSLLDGSFMSSRPFTDDTSKFLSDDNMGDANSEQKMFNLNHCVSRSLPVNGPNSGSNADGTGSEKKPKKVKLKMGGVTRTIQAKSTSYGASSSGSLAKTNQSSASARSRQTLILEEHSDEYDYPPMDKGNGLQGHQWKDFSKDGLGISKEDSGKTRARIAFERQGEKSDSVRKSKRAPKRRVMDGEFDEDDEDDEIRYLEKLKTSKMTGYKAMDVNSARKSRKNVEDVGRPTTDARKSRSGDVDYEEEEFSDSEHKGNKKKKQKKDESELPTENKEIALTTRQRALLSKDAPSASGANQIEFPNGLPPAPSRKQKEKLTEVEQQLKKVEAAQRRRMQNEKAARESEAEAIRKILGQDSSKKKREEKMKKRQEELAQEKATSAEMLASNTIRTVMGPTGTTVTFPIQMGFPKLFDPKPCSYPPPREKCAGPSCSNPYKYRDSKSKLPLCSLQCYKAVNENTQTEKAG